MESNTVYCFCGHNYDSDKFMVQCDYCKEWYHGSCVSVKEYTVIEIDKFHCPRCIPVYGPSILKPRTNWHRHEFWDPEAMGKPVQTGTAVFIRELCSRHFPSEGEIVIHIPGHELTENYLNQNGFDTPLVVDRKDGLDILIPPETFTLNDVESYVGGDKEIDVIDVTRQTDIKMTLREFVQYFNNKERNRIFNVVSLEFSNTSLSRLVEAPIVARKLDWVNIVWPKESSKDGHPKPQVQKYCLMSVKNSYTDFHIDFGGTSVWYHVLKGEKIFYFIRPTPANLILYQQWMTSSTQNETFFGDQVDQCFKCVLRQGQTMLIPTGWIHAVYTPVDSLVFGGNFLHSLNISMQLQVYDIEKKTKTAEKFRYPHFETINWYAAKKIMGQLKDLNSNEKKCPKTLLAGIKTLLSVLKQWNTDKDYNMSNREQIPDVINSHKLLKDLGKEIRHAERFLNSLNPPKPERESKRKRKRPVNKDFVDFFGNNTKLVELNPAISASKQETVGKDINQPISTKLSLPKSLLVSHDKLTPSSSQSGIIHDNQNPSAVLAAGSRAGDKNWSEYLEDPNERWIVTDVGDRPGAVLKFTLGSKEASAAESNSESISKSVYDFHDFGDNFDDEFALKIDENPKKSRTSTKTKQTVSKKVALNVGGTANEVAEPKNGIESLLKASALTNKFMDSGRTSPSTQEAIAGMLSIGQQSYNMSITSHGTSSKSLRQRKTVQFDDHYEENISKVHQDEEYIYPSLDNSDEEDFEIFKSRGRSKIDETWNPKARVGPLLPKMNRPAREGTKKQSVEKVLEAAAAKRASEPQLLDTHKRVYRKKKFKVSKILVPQELASTSSSQTPTAHPPPAQPVSQAKPRKGMKTAKQRLGKILKIHRMIH